MAEPPVLAVVGPTAVGKSALGIELAHALDGEVINADSMQLYRGMDIGTAKLPLAEREGVPHHVLDVWDVSQAASVADYQRLARAAIDDIRQRGRTPILVGGSGLYVQAAIDDLDFPGTDPVVRSRLEAELELVGAPALHRRLATLDPAAAAANSPNNGRRIVRALEVIEITGQKFSAGPGMTAYRSVYADARLVGVRRALDDLDERIERRVDLMLERGLVHEVRALEAVGLRSGVTARRALGYQQVLALLAGECSEKAARDHTVQATRRFVRRQLSWFRRDPRVHWLDAGPDSMSKALAVVAD